MRNWLGVENLQRFVFFLKSIIKKQVQEYEIYWF